MPSSPPLTSNNPATMASTTTKRTMLPSRTLQQQQSKRPSLSQSSRLLSTDSMYFGIPTTVETKDHAEEEHGEHSWRYRVVEYLHTPMVQRTMSALLVTDILLLFLELFLLATYPHCSIIERDGLSCVALSSHADDDIDHSNRFLADATAAVCDVGYDWNGAAAGCDSSKWHAVHTLEQYVFSLTILILSIFLLELTVEMIALTPQVFFRQFWFLLDYVIISISLALEIAFRVKQEEVYQSFAGVLVVVRIWRFVRIGHGIVEVTHENVNHQGRELLLYVEELEGLLQSNGIALPGSAKRIHEVHHDHATHLLETIEERSHPKINATVKDDYDDEDEEDLGGDEEQAKETALASEKVAL